MEISKRGLTSFGSIVAIFGSILIAVGFAWLIASNWHQMPAFIKIFILISITCASYIAGVFLDKYDYKKIGHAFYVLGVLMYALTIFLIAQIFNICGIGAQCYANLSLLALLGAIITAYVFISYVALFIAFIEFLSWLGIQIATWGLSSHFISGATIAFYFLCAGVVLYSIGLLHRIKKHEFSGLYQWWAAFYFLFFMYIISFQILIPILWSGETSSILLSKSIVIYLLIFAAVTLIIFITSIIFSISKKGVNLKELIGILIIIITLLTLISLTNLTSNTVGRCYEKTCYDYKTQNECSAIQKCEWIKNNYAPDNSGCLEKSCYNYNTSELCNAQYTITGCKWINSSYYSDIQVPTENGEIVYKRNLTEKWQCNKIDCYSLRSQSECNNAPTSLNCLWNNDMCIYNYQDTNSKGCNQYSNEHDQCLIHKECEWKSGSDYGYGRNSQKAPLTLWIIWIIINIAFILLILAIIGYGTIEKMPSIINLGILFFALDIITRYIGFIIDLWSYNILSLIFISGGIILLFGGWFIERWRRKLISEVKK